MSEHIHAPWPDFLKDRFRYEECESDWVRIIEELAASVGSAQYWEQPRMGLAGDGTRLPLSGNPIANGQSVRLNRRFKVLQHPIVGDTIDFTWWTEEETDPELIERGPQFALVISLSASEPSLQLTKALLAIWLSPELEVSTFEDLARSEVRKAEAWFRTAADAGDAIAMTNLATLISSRAVQELAEAERLIRDAADDGNPDAMIRLAQLSIDKSEVDLGDLSDSYEPERLYRMAAGIGHLGAMALLGQFLESKTAPTISELNEAESLYRAAAEKGDLDAMFLLGRILELRRGPNPESERLYRASQGL